MIAPNPSNPPSAVSVGSESWTFLLPLQDSNLVYLIQSRADRVCLEDTMSVSGGPPSIGARRLGGQCPDWPGETIVKCLQRVLNDSLDTPSGEGSDR